jgi:hypothetical protein
MPGEYGSNKSTPHPQLWVTDVTEHPTIEGKVYCAVVLDVWSRRVIGWSIDGRPTTALVTSALGMAIDQRRPNRSTIIHSDQGTQTGLKGSTQHLMRSPRSTIPIGRAVPMIRNFAILKLKSDARPDQVDALVAAMQHLRVKGMSGLIVHRDAALRPGNSDVLVVCDLEDEEAYRRYDTDEEHNRIRRELAAPITERAERMQVRL